MDVNSLLKTVTRQRRDCDLNTSPAPESSTLTTQLPSHPVCDEGYHYRAMLCIRGTSHGPVSVCLSVTSRSTTKTAKLRITQTTPNDSRGTLVF